MGKHPSMLVRTIALSVAVCATAACGGGAATSSSPSPSSTEPASPTAGSAPGPAPSPLAGRPAAEKPRAATPIADEYREAANRIIAAATADRGGWEKLRYLSHRIGHRLSGSRGLEQAVEWSVATLRADGHENVRAEKVMVPHWVRGAESAELIAPVARPIALLGLGGSGPTPRKGLVGDVVVVRDFAELERLGDKVKGKIVLFNHAMPPHSEEKGSGYGEAVAYRTAGPARAAALGARAALIRSLTARSLRSPHTGATRFADKQKPIPAAAISLEDADLIAELAGSGEPVRLKLSMGARLLPDAASANVVGELRGREKPDEIVVISGHLDSWDVGHGAHDDGAGCVTAMQALTLLRQLGLRPRRTIRAVLFTNEENGLRGGRQYAIDHAAEMSRHVMALESDSGAFQPRGFHVEGSDAALGQVSDIFTLLEPIDAHRAEPGDGGADISQLGGDVPKLGSWVDGSSYFDYHHSHADTLDKVDPALLNRHIAAVAVVAYVIADMPARLAPGPPPRRTP